MRTAQQAAGIEESSAALQQLSVSVGQTAANAEKASGAVRETQEKAKSSGELVKRGVGHGGYREVVRRDSQDHRRH